MTNKPQKKVNLSITNETVFNAVKIFISILIALAVTFVVLCLVSKNPVNAFTTILFGPLKKARYMGVAIEKTVPYAFAGLACGILFKAGFFNLGAEGIFVISGVVVALIATSALTTSTVIHPILCILGASLVGGTLMLIPAVLKAKFNTNILVLSLMLNSIYAGVAAFIIRNFCLSTTTSTLGSKDYLATAKIGYLIEKYHVSACFFLLLIVTALVYIVLFKTKLGYQIRLAGENPRFAEYSGINAFKLSMITNFIAGVLAAIGSASQCLTQTSFYIPSQSVTGIGFTGCLLAMLGRNNPIGILVATFFIQYLEEGTRVLYLKDNSVPAEIVAIVEGIMVLLISSQYFLRRFRERQLLKEGLGSDVK